MNRAARHLMALSLLLAPSIVLAAVYPDQGEAYAACQKDIATGPDYWQPMKCNLTINADGGGFYTPVHKAGAAVWGIYSWVGGKSCRSRPEESGWQGGETAATVNVCHTGCMYSSSLDPSSSSGFTYYPTGGACTETDAPAPTPAGDGGDPGEGGGGDGGGTDPGGGDGGGDNGGGDGDGGGTNPGGGDGGGTGPGGGDGGGDNGGGDGGGGTGPGPGPGPGDGDGDGDGPGTPGTDGDALYEHDKDLTVEKVYTEFEQRVKKAPIIDATKKFFTVSVGGSCPVFTVPATAYWDAMTFDLHCSGTIYTLLQLIGWVLLAMAAHRAGEVALT